MRHLLLCLVVAASACTKEGPTGPAGARGDKGDPGAPGMNGMDGMNGIDGMPGMNGTDGLDGMPGAPGMNGQSGAPGESVEISVEDAGVNCATGGTRFAIGRTRPAISYACNGDPAQLYRRTVVVRSGGTASENGAALLATLAALSPAPSAAQRWRVMLEPGDYQVASTVNLDGLTLEGAGPDATVISGSPVAGPLARAGDSAAVRALTFRRTQVAAPGVVLLLSLPLAATARFRDVHVTSDFGTIAGAVSSFVEQELAGAAVFQDCFIGGVVRSTIGAGALVTGYQRTGGKTTLEGVDVFVTTEQVFEVVGARLAGGGDISLRNVTVTTNGISANRHTGLHVIGPTTARGVDVKLMGSTSGPASSTQAVTAGDSVSGHDYSFDQLVLGQTVSTGPNAFGALGSSRVTVRGALIIGYGSGIRGGANTTLRLYDSVVSPVTGFSAIQTCAGLKAPDGTPVTCL